jgi:hypothetical protein
MLDQSARAATLACAGGAGSERGGAPVEGLWHGGADSSGARTSARRSHWRGVDGEVARLGSVSTVDSELRWATTLAGDGGAPVGYTWKRGGVSEGGQRQTGQRRLWHLPGEAAALRASLRL